MSRCDCVARGGRCCQRGSVAPSEYDKEREWVPLWLSALLLAPCMAMGMVTLYWVFGEYLHLLTGLIR